MFFAATVPAYAIGFFITVILMGMGYTMKEAFLLTAPPYIAAVRFHSFHISDHSGSLHMTGYFLLLLRLARGQDEEARALARCSSSHHDRWSCRSRLGQAAGRSLLRHLLD